MDQEGMSFQEALAEAQEKGFAEADPTSDIEGEDAAYKLSILTHGLWSGHKSKGDTMRGHKTNFRKGNRLCQTAGL